MPMQRTLSARSRGLLSDPVETNYTSTRSYSTFWCILSLLSIALSIYLTQTWKPIDYDNIGNVRADHYLSYGPIDVVYTWVNGTDPRWKRDKEYWHKHWIASLTGQPLPKLPEDIKDVKGTDISNADNRFRDNEELRYSLRSLEKYAPWIRRIYIVTDGQIPSWLNLENSKIQIIKHQDIFNNQSHLPVFSSPAIEWQLDNIPNLSDYFIYFNDDVFLGSYVYPEDFFTQQGVQKVYFAWEAPLCSSGCWDSWLGNGRCDAQCNTTACDFDLGDCGCQVTDYVTNQVVCDPIKVAEIQELAPKPMKMSPTICVGTCQYNWLGDGGCDQSCNVTSCGFDAGDCNGPTALLNDEHGFMATIEQNHTLVHVFSGINATVLDLSEFFGREQSRVLSASHDNDKLIRHATLFEQEMALLLVFGRDDSSEPMTEGAIVTVYGQRLVESEGGGSSHEKVVLEIELVRGFKPVVLTYENKTSGFFSFQNVSVKPRQIRLPLGLRQSKWWVDEVNLQDKWTEPELSVFLPFNITNKPTKTGESFTLAMKMNLRLHSDGEDEEDDERSWSDSQFCRLTTPGPITVKKKKPVQTVEIEVDGKGEGNAVDDKETKTNPAKEEEISLCRVVEHGVIVTWRLPTHDNVHEYSEQYPEPNEGKNELERNEPAIIPASVEEEQEVEKEAITTFVPSHRPQVVDGTVCFYNLDQKQRQYCFALALGHFQSHHVVAQLRPPTPLTKAQERAVKRELVKNAPYEPYTGPNEAWLEFENGLCRDTTFRLLGFRPQKCFPTEVPAKSHSDPSHDPLVQNTEEGRRIACEALRRRRAHQKDDTLTMNTTPASRSWIHQLLQNVMHRLFTGTVERTTEEVEEGMEEEEEVCKPFLDEERAAHVAQMTAANAEALLSKDTFGDSLRYVNKLYTRAFGKATSRRRVPSHMPFLLNRKMLREIKEQWPNQIQATSSHRFRHPQDFQFSFAYFHYLLNRYKIKPPSLESIWKEYIDVNQNGIIDENELLTIASLAFGDYPPDSYVEEIKQCLQPLKQEKVKEMSTSQGIVLISETLTPYLTFEHIAQCTNVSERLIKNVRRTVEKEAVVVPTEEEITFHMLSDQYRIAWNQMLGTRARRTKFVCINDDMKWPSKAVSQILHELFLSIWPKRSQFELPYHLKNRYDHIDEYLQARERRWYYLYIVGSVLILFMFVYRMEIKQLIGFQEIARAREKSASQLTNAILQQQIQQEEEE